MWELQNDKTYFLRLTSFWNVKKLNKSNKLDAWRN